MGGCTSIPVDDDEKKRRQVASQRRRLSMAPEKVGDTKGAANPTQKDTDHPDNEEGGETLHKVTSQDSQSVAQQEQSPGDQSEGVSSPNQQDPANNSNLNGGDPSQPENGGAGGGYVKKLIRIAHHTKKGYVPYNHDKVNQDRFIVRHSLCDDPGLSVFGVFDGHGEFGHLVADFVKTYLPVYLEQLPIRENPCEAICCAIEELTKALAASSINITFSGTTAVFALKVDDTLYVANIGDSRCVLARYAAHDPSTLEAVPLSNDHKPSAPAERARILAAGGRVAPLTLPPDAPADEDCGPDRVWLPDYDIPGLAMSRSIGDEISQRVGVVSAPEIIQYTLTSNDIFAIFASDGVWEFVSNELAVYTIYKALPSISDATRNIVNLSVQKWKENEEVIDDITVVIAQFNYDGE